MSDGAVLAHDQLLRRLQRGEIFRKGSWEISNLRGAAYDLRIANTFLVIPSARGTQFRRYSRSETRRDTFVLLPGQVALVSTMERLCVPWDLSGNLGIKFDLARHGIVILTGLLVDPGYGLQKDRIGRWVPRADERLHFLLAHLGSDPVSLVPGEQKIASIQFLRVYGNPDTNRDQVSTAAAMDDLFLDPKSDPGLVFVERVRTLELEFRDLRGHFEGMERGGWQINLFGAMVVFASFLGGTIAFILAILQSDPARSNIALFLNAVPPGQWREVGTLAVMVVSLQILTYLGLWSVRLLLWGIIRSRRGRRTR